MEELCKKYPALCVPADYIYLLSQFKIEFENKDKGYANFKANISCIGLEPEEYDQVIKWFCDTMGY